MPHAREAVGTVVAVNHGEVLDRGEPGGEPPGVRVGPEARKDLVKEVEETRSAVERAVEDDADRRGAVSEGAEPEVDKSGWRRDGQSSISPGVGDRVYRVEEAKKNKKIKLCGGTTFENF